MVSSGELKCNAVLLVVFFLIYALTENRTRGLDDCFCLLKKSRLISLELYDSEIAII